MYGTARTASFAVIPATGAHTLWQIVAATTVVAAVGASLRLIPRRMR
jgi:hypothetical protein